jgi:uncharacterized protein YjdB
VANGTATITAVTADGNRTATCAVSVTSGNTNIPVTGVALNKQSASLTVGGSETLYATVSPPNATNQSVTWYSSNTSVATVSQSGYVYASSAGSAAITVTTLDGNYTAACYVTVSAVVNPNQTPVASDYDITDLSQVYNGQPKVVSITPKAGKSPGNVTVYYDGSPAAPSAVGTYTITFSVAAATGWQGASALSGGTLVITSASVPVTGVTLNKPSTTITAGNSETLIANIAPSDATNKSVSWNSSNTAVATVSGGTVTAVSAGSANITVTTVDGGFSATCAVTVTATDIAVTFDSVTANGSLSQTSTQLTLTFSAPINGLTATDITLSGVSGVVKGALSGSNPYTLAISGFTTSGNVNVSVTKAGYTISGTPKTVAIYYTAPTIEVTFNNVTADGSASQTSTQLTLTFSAPINGLTDEDITLSGVSGVVKGAFSGSNPYTLTISGFTSSGTLTVRAEKEGYRVAGAQTVAIYYVAPITPTNLASYLASLPINTVSTPHTITLKVTSTDEFTTISLALWGASNKYVYLDFTGSTVTSIENNSFHNNDNLIGITISSGITSIGNDAFFSCDNLSSIIISDSVTSIGNGVFYACINLSSITIPDSVTSIGENVFGSCKSLTSITIPNSVTSIGQRAFSQSGLISITLPDSVSKINDCTFSGSISLTSVNIPNSVTSIGNYAFDGCTSLTSITIPDSVTSINSYSFYRCTSLASVIIGSGVNSIDLNAFYTCTILASVTFKGTIPISGFYIYAFDNNLRAKFYETNSTLGTPGIYTTTSPGFDSKWTLQP